MSRRGEESPAIAVVVLTHNRVHLLRQCVENVLARTSSATREIVIWDNASSDATPHYLDSLDDPRIRVVHHPQNVGQNAYAHAFRLTTAEYLVELDDDVIDAPPEWDRTLLEAIRKLPEFGFLAANLVDDPHDQSAYVMHHVRAHLYSEAEINGVRLLLGPTGGGCAITPRWLNERVGGFRQRNEIFWLEDAAYIADIERLGYRAGFLAGLEVHHAGGPFYARPSPEKARYWARYHRKIERKDSVKRVLLRVPLLPALNARFGWFSPPDAVEKELQETERAFAATAGGTRDLGGGS
jgi:GT2 family glycosyltransferase